MIHRYPVAQTPLALKRDRNFGNDATHNGRMQMGKCRLRPFLDGAYTRRMSKML